jgi:hypothetical protein
MIQCNNLVHITNFKPINICTYTIYRKPCTNPWLNPLKPRKEPNLTLFNPIYIYISYKSKPHYLCISTCNLSTSTMHYNPLASTCNCNVHVSKTHKHFVVHMNVPHNPLIRNSRSKARGILLIYY